MKIKEFTTYFYGLITSHFSTEFHSQNILEYIFHSSTKGAFILFINLILFELNNHSIRSHTVAFISYT